MKNSRANWVTVLFCIAYGIYMGWIGVNQQKVEFASVAIIYLISAIGFYQLRQYSKYFIYLLSFFTITSWGASAWHFLREHWHSQGMSETTIMLFPGALMLGLHLFAAFTVRRAFASSADQ